MKPETILKKTIEKSVKNGWEITIDGIKVTDWSKADLESIAKEPIVFRGIFFDPEFAKAFWNSTVKGKPTIVCNDCGEIIGNIGYCTWGHPEAQARVVWQYHQHKMLDEIQEGRNPIKYLEKYL